MDEDQKISSTHTGENQKGVFQSLAGFTFNKEPLKAGLAILSTVDDSELDVMEITLLHPEEIKTGQSYPSEVRRRSFFHGRIAGKLAMNQVFPEIPLASIHIMTGSSGDPLFKNLACPYGISIAHGELWSAGLCFPLSVPMGIDVESINEKNRSIIPAILSDQEKEMCRHGTNDQELLHILWTAKEAAGKAIRLGFRVPHEWYEVACIETIRQGAYKIYRCRFTHLTLFTALSVKIPKGVLSIAFPADQGLEPAITSLFENCSINSI